MSSTVQHKLQGLEQIPPEGIWLRIAAELDDSALGQKFPATLQNTAVLPPARCWEEINALLDQDIASHDMAGRLLNTEIPPPQSAWDKIRSTLDDEVAQPGIRRKSPWLKYAAAASLIGILAFGAVTLMNADNDTSTTNVVPVIKTETPVPATVDTDLPESEKEATALVPDEEEARNDAALEASKKTYAKLDVPSRKRVEIASQFSFSHYLPDEELSEHSSSGYEEALVAPASTVNRYIVLMTPDGHFIRMSKKLSDLVCCVSGEEVDENCKTQMEKWRKQLAGSQAAHPGNFMDILHLVGSLRDN